MRSWQPQLSGRRPAPYAVGRLGVLLVGALATFRFVLGAGDALGDEVRMSNGSVLKGRIVRMEQGKLLVEVGFAEDPIGISLPEVEALSTEATVEVETFEGESLRGKIAIAEGGMVLEPVGGGEPRPLDWRVVEAIYAPTTPWSAEVTVGGSVIEGNADVLAPAISGSFIRDTGANRLAGSGAFQAIFVDNDEAARNASLALQYDHFFDERLYLHGIEELHHDRFEDLEARSMTTAGLGYVLYQRPAKLLQAEAGVGYLIEQFKREPDTEGFALRGSFDYQTPIASLALFENDFVIYLSPEDWQAQVVNTTKLSVALGRRWGLILTGIFYHDTHPSFVAQPTDLNLTFGFQYKL